MKIGAYMQVNQIYQSNKPKKTGKSGRTAESSDKIELSDFGRELSVARKAVADAPEIRENRVEELKASIQSGSYDLSMDRLVNKFVENYFG